MAKRMMSMLLVFVMLLSLLPGGLTVIAAAEPDDPQTQQVQENQEKQEEQEKQENPYSGYCSSAAEHNDKTGVTWSWSNVTGVLTIEGHEYREMADYSNSGAQPPWQALKGNITKIVVKNVDTIGAFAFTECTNVQEADLSESGATAIHESAFEKCTALSEVKLPESLEVIGSAAFRDCKSLRTIAYSQEKTAGQEETAASTQREGALFSEKLQELGTYAFMNCTALKSVSFSEKTSQLRMIGESCFENCTSLVSFYLPYMADTGKFTCGDGCFMECDVLSHVELGGPCTLSFGEDVDYDSSGAVTGFHNGETYSKGYSCWITSVNGHREASKNIFSFLFSSSRRFDMGYWNISASSASQVWACLRENQTSGGAYTDTYTLVIRGSGDTRNYSSEDDRPWNAFAGRITAVEFVNMDGTPATGITSLGSRLFSGLTQLTEIDLPSSVTSIGLYCFRDCKILKEITLPQELRTLGREAFYNCSALKKVNLFNKVNDAGSNAFYGVGTSGSPCTIYVESGVDVKSLLGYDSTNKTLGGGYMAICVPFYLDTAKKTYWYVEEGANNEKILHFVGDSEEGLTLKQDMPAVGSNNEQWCTEENRQQVTKVNIEVKVKDIADQTFQGFKKLQVFSFAGNFAGSLETIGEKAFEGCTALSSTGIAGCSNLKFIGDSAYSGCANIFGFSVPNNVETLGTGVFKGCTNLSQVSLSSKMTNLPQETFSGCVKLAAVEHTENLVTMGKNAFYGCSSLSNFTIPAGVATLEEGVFAEAGLESIVIPGTVTGINAGAFRECSKLLHAEFASAALPAMAADCFSNVGASSPCGLSFPKEYTGTAPNPAEAWHGGYFKEMGYWKVGEEVVAYLTVKNVSPAAYVLHLEGQGGIYNYNSDGGVLPPWKDSAAEITDVQLQSGITGIGNELFKDCVKLSNIALPYTVVTLGARCFENCAALTSLAMPEGLVEVKDAAFKGCSSLQDMIFHENVLNLGSSIFSGCTALRSVTMHDGVKSIGEEMFYQCRSLPTLTLPETVESIGDRAFAGCKLLDGLTIPTAVTAVGESAFEDCAALSYMALPDGITVLENKTFKNCESLATVFLPVALDSIGEEAFYGCKVLDGISLPMTAKTMGAGAFRNCKALTSITLPTEITAVADDTFHGCENLTSVQMFKGLTSIGKSAFEGCMELRKVSLPSTVTVLGEKAFYQCANLYDLDMPETMEKIGESAFDSCVSLYGILLPEGIKEIAAGTFRNCSNLKEIKFPDTVAAIGNEAFLDCLLLEELQFSRAVATVGDSAFRGCTSVNFVRIARKDTKFGSNAFLNVGTEDTPADIALPYDWNDAQPESEAVTLSGGIFRKVPLGDRRNPWQIGFSLTAWLDDQHTLFVEGSGAMDDFEDMNHQPWQEKRTEITDIVLSTKATTIGNNAFKGFTELSGFICDGVSSLESIGENAFRDCGKLFTFDMPKAVVRVGNNAFRSCKTLSELTLSDKLTTIGNGAFMGCAYLSKVTLPADMETIGASAFENSGVENLVIPAKVSAVGTGAFRNCRALKGVTFGAGEGELVLGEEAFKAVGVESVTLSEQVKAIPERAFAGCTALKSLAVPGTVVTIGQEAFNGCTSLGEVTLEAGVESIGSSAFAGCTGLTKLTMDEGLTTVGNSAFSGCALLEKADLPATVNAVGEGAFGGCTGLQKVLFKGDAPETLSATAFTGVGEDPVCRLILTDRWTKEAPQAGEGVAWQGGKFTVYTTELYAVVIDEATQLKFFVTDVEENGGVNEVMACGYVGEHTYVEIPADITVLKPETQEGKRVFQVVGVTGEEAFAGLGEVGAPIPLLLPDHWDDDKPYGSRWYGGYFVYSHRVVFNAEGGTNIDETQRLVADGTKTAKPKDPVKSGYVFGGWYYHSSDLLLPWNFGSTFVKNDLDLHAKWIPKDTPQDEVTGKVYFSGEAVPDAVVELWLGQKKIASVTSNELGGFYMDSVETGYYNLKTSKDERSVIQLIRVVKNRDGVSTLDVKLPLEKVTTTLALYPDDSGRKARSEEITVGGMDEIAVPQEKATQIGMSVKAENESDAFGTRPIRRLAGNQRTLEYYDVELTNGEKSIDETDTMMVLNIPFDVDEVSNLAVYRCHDTNGSGVADNEEARGLVINPEKGEEGYVVDEDAQVITVYTTKFSTYAIGYTEGAGKKDSKSSRSSSEDSSGGKTFTVDFTEVTAVYVDGKKIDKSYYTVKGNKVTVSADYMATLSGGEHEFRAEGNNNSQGTASFTVKNGRAVGAVRSGDAGITAFVILGAAAVCGVVLVLIRRKRGKD